MYIYRIFNKKNGRFYIGSTNNYLTRKHEHFGNLRNGTHHNKYLQYDFIAFGSDAFVFEVLINNIHDRTTLLLKEYEMIIKSKKKCYNIHTDCPVFDPIEKQDWSIYKTPFIPRKNKRANSKLKKHHSINHRSPRQK